MRKFHHIGLVTTEPKPAEAYYEDIKVWGTGPDNDPVNRIEWVRFAPDSPLAGTAVAKGCHVSYAVDDLDAELAGKTVVIGPLAAAPGVRIAYFFEEGLLTEYLEIK